MSNRRVLVVVVVVVVAVVVVVVAVVVSDSVHYMLYIGQWCIGRQLTIISVINIRYRTVSMFVICQCKCCHLEIQYNCPEHETSIVKRTWCVL